MQRVVFICHGTFKKGKKKKIPYAEAKGERNGGRSQYHIFARAIISRRGFRMGSERGFLPQLAAARRAPGALSRSNEAARSKCRRLHRFM